MIKFIYNSKLPDSKVWPGGHDIEATCTIMDSDITLSEIFEQFTFFLRGIGYQVDGEIGILPELDNDNDNEPEELKSYE